ncbi:MAG: hypothetical protein ACWGON_03355 [Gemmatimonadota bacterium]
MRVFLFVAGLALGLSACGSDSPTGGPGQYPDMTGVFVGPYQQSGVSGAETVTFQCDMKVEVLDQFEGTFLADVYFLQGQDCAQEVLWSEATTGEIDLDGNVTLGWDNSEACNSFDGDKQFEGALAGNALSLTAAYTCDGWSFSDSYTGTRD